MTGTLAGKVAVITGGASGIGLGSVELFVAEGAKVLVGDIQDDLGEALAARYPGEVAYAHADVSDAAQVEALVGTAVDRFGRLDVMFNNAAGGGDRSPLTELTAEGFEATVRLITGSVVAGHTYATRQFVAQGGGGSIITTASGASFAGGWSSTGYTIAKHAVVGVIHTAAAELGPLGIRSNAIAPGIIMTPLLARSFGIPDDRAAEFQDFLGARLAGSQPLGRVGRPRDIAAAALFLASDASEWITGVVLPVDGGAAAVTQGHLREDFVAGARAFQAQAQAQGQGGEAG